MSEKEPKLIIVHTVNRSGETVRMRAVFASRLSQRLLKDQRVQELLGETPTLSEEPLVKTSAHVVGVIVERGRRPIQVIPLIVADAFTPTP